MKNRRPKDPLTPHQVAALTSAVTRHQTAPLPTPLLSPQQIQSPNHRIGDYNHHHHHRQTQMQQDYIPTQPPMSFHRHNSNQYKSPLPNYRPNTEQNTNTIPILQRLFQAQQRQQ